MAELHTEFTWRKIKLLSVYKEASLELPHMVIYVYCLVVQKKRVKYDTFRTRYYDKHPCHVIQDSVFLYLSILFRITQIKVFVFGSSTL